MFVTGKSYGNTFHFFALASGARLVSMGDGPLFNKECSWRRGPSAFTSVGFPALELEPQHRLATREGDELWAIEGDEPFVGALVQWLPAGQRLRETAPLPDADRIRRFVVEGAE